MLFGCLGHNLYVIFFFLTILISLLFWRHEREFFFLPYPHDAYILEKNNRMFCREIKLKYLNTQSNVNIILLCHLGFLSTAIFSLMETTGETFFFDFFFHMNLTHLQVWHHVNSSSFLNQTQLQQCIIFNHDHHETCCHRKMVWCGPMWIGDLIDIWYFPVTAQPGVLCLSYITAIC